MKIKKLQWSYWYRKIKKWWSITTNMYMKLILKLKVIHIRLIENKKRKICTIVNKMNKIMYKNIYRFKVWWNQQKYFFKINPLMRNVSDWPSKVCRWKVLGPNFSAMPNEPNQRCWILVCSPFILMILIPLKQ